MRAVFFFISKAYYELYKTDLYEDTRTQLAPRMLLGMPRRMVLNCFPSPLSKGACLHIVYHIGLSKRKSDSLLHKALFFFKFLGDRVHVLNHFLDGQIACFLRKKSFLGICYDLNIKE